MDLERARAELLDALDRVLRAMEQGGWPDAQPKSGHYDRYRGFRERAAAARSETALIGVAARIAARDGRGWDHAFSGSQGDEVLRLLDTELDPLANRLWNALKP